MPDAEVVEGVSKLPREEWDALVGEASPFLEWGWLASLEQAGAVGGRTGWSPRPLVLRENGRLVAACPLYVKSNSEGEFVFDWSWADAAERAGIRYYPKLLVGVPFTPVGGARFLVAPGVDRASAVEQLGGAVRELVLANDLSGAHVNFCLPDEVEPLRRAGFLERTGVQYHWHNHGYETFEDYLGHFRSKRRNQIRRERREMDERGIEIEALVGEAIPDDLFSTMFELYLTTIEHRAWGRQYLNPEFFELLASQFRERLCFVVARRGGEVIAGTTNVQKGDALYGRYWGAFRPLRHLHFNVCYYAGVEHCIRSGLQRFEPGAGGEYKKLRGFDAQPTHSLHFLADERLSHAVGRFLEAEREEAAEAIDWMQENSALKPKSD